MIEPINMLKLIGKLFLRLNGWTIADHTPKGIQDVKRCVIVAAPHTSNWDYPFAMSVFYALGVKVRFLAKDSLFKFPLGLIMKGSGGIPVYRSQRNNLVQTMIDLFASREELRLMIPAEGTRSFVREWKSGFYHVAYGAKVPIVLGFLDFKEKKGGFLNVYYPSGNYAKDLYEIQKLYSLIHPKNPDQYSLKDMKFD